MERLGKVLEAIIAEVEDDVTLTRYCSITGIADSVCFEKKEFDSAEDNSIVPRLVW